MKNHFVYHSIPFSPRARIFEKMMYCIEVAKKHYFSEDMSEQTIESYYKKFTLEPYVCFS
jgi:hypothetical protein